MQYYQLEDLYEELDRHKKEAKKLRTGIAIYSKTREKNLDNREKADSLEKDTKALEKELSTRLFKCAIIEGIINREEGHSGIHPK